MWDGLYTYQNTVEVKSITLQRSKLARMDFYTSTGRGSYGDQIDFYWNVNELINQNIFNVENVENMTVIDKWVTDHEKEVPKLSVEQRVKYRRIM